MAEVQVHSDGVPRDPPRTYQEAVDRLRPFILAEYHDLDVGVAAVTRGKQNIRYQCLILVVMQQTFLPHSFDLRSDFIRLRHFWTGIPIGEMLAWKDRELLHHFIKSVLGEIRNQDAGTSA